MPISPSQYLQIDQMVNDLGLKRAKESRIRTALAARFNDSVITGYFDQRYQQRQRAAKGPIKLPTAVILVGLVLFTALFWALHMRMEAGMMANDVYDKLLASPYPEEAFYASLEVGILVYGPLMASISCLLMIPVVLVKRLRNKAKKQMKGLV